MAFKYEVQKRVDEHYVEALKYFDKDHIVGIFLQGSQNYGLEIPNSDVDTKLIVTPTFEEIARNARPHSTTHIRENDEHIDFKDVRLYMETFKKQNLNFLEILFTDYSVVPALYAKQWMRLIAAREQIAHMNPCRAVKSMYGVAMEKWHAMEHEYPSKVEVLKKYGYDPKQLHHLLRVEDFMERYIAGESYEECMYPLDPGYLLDVKLGTMDLMEARNVGLEALEHITEMVDNFCFSHEQVVDKEAEELLKDVQVEIMKISIKQELK